MSGTETPRPKLRGFSAVKAAQAPRLDALNKLTGALSLIAATAVACRLTKTRRTANVRAVTCVATSPLPIMFPRSLLAFCLLGGIAHAQSASSSSDAALAKSVALPAGPLGQGAWRFEVDPGWAKVPAGVTLGPTHGGVAVDKAGNIYVSSDGPNGILVFDKSGKYLRGLTQELSGIHGLLIRQEGDKEYIYGARAGAGQAVKARSTVNSNGRSTCQSRVVSTISRRTKKKPTTFKPTGIAIGPDNRIYIADGYGASVIHMYSDDRKYLKTIGTKAKARGSSKPATGSRSIRVMARAAARRGS